MRLPRNKVTMEAISATPSLPSVRTAETAAGVATGVLKVVAADGSVPDAVSISVEFDDVTGNQMPGILFGYDTDLAAWLPSRRMTFGDYTEILADTTETIAGRFQVYLDSSISHVWFMPDFDNKGGTTAAATEIDYKVVIDEHREHF